MKTVYLLLISSACSAQVLIGTSTNIGTSFAKNYGNDVSFRQNVNVGYSINKTFISVDAGASTNNIIGSEIYTDQNGNSSKGPNTACNLKYAHLGTTVGYMFGRIGFRVSPSYDLAISSTSSSYRTGIIVDVPKQNCYSVSVGVDYHTNGKSEFTFGVNYYRQLKETPMQVIGVRIGYIFNTK